jgi:hypothetical protein
MDVDEIVHCLSWTLDVDLPLRDRQQLANQLLQILLRDNRKRAEEQGIGLESQLSPKTLYSVQELLLVDDSLSKEGDWLFQYARALNEICATLPLGKAK